MRKCHMNMAARTEMQHQTRNKRPQLSAQGCQKRLRQHKNNVLQPWPQGSSKNRNHTNLMDSREINVLIG